MQIYTHIFVCIYFLIPTSVSFCSEDGHKINLEATSSKNHFQSENKNVR